MERWQYAPDFVHSKHSVHSVLLLRFMEQPAGPLNQLKLPMHINIKSMIMMITKNIRTFNMSTATHVPKMTRSFLMLQPAYLVTPMLQECVAVSIDNCPWHDSMQFGFKLRWLNTESYGNNYQHTKLHHCSYITLLKLQHVLWSMSI